MALFGRGMSSKIDSVVVMSACVITFLLIS